MIIEIGRLPVWVPRSDGTSITARKLFIRDKDGIRELFNQGPGVETNHLSLVLRGWLFNKTLRVSHDLEKAIRDFLRLYHAADDLEHDCYAFVSLAKGLPRHRKKLLHAYWHITPLQGEPEEGDAVFFLTRETSWFHHAAIYLGKDLYLSVLGAGGDLAVMTMKSMCECFTHTDICIAKPKSSEEYRWTDSLP